MQTKLESLIEAFINVFIGFWISFCANAIVLPLVGLPVSVSQNILIGLALTIVSVARQYTIRRWAQKYLTATKVWIVKFLKKEVA